MSVWKQSWDYITIVGGIAIIAVWVWFGYNAVQTFGWHSLLFALATVLGMVIGSIFFDRRRASGESDQQRRKRLRKAARDMDREIERLGREQDEKSAARVRVAEELTKLEPERAYRVGDPSDEDDEPEPESLVDKNRA